MSRPSSARGRRGIKQEAAELAARRGPGRPPKPPAATAPPAPPAPAPGTATVAVAGAPTETQGAQFGLMVRAMVAPLYLAVCGFELPPAAWEEWGVAGGRFAAHYFPDVATHPATQFVAASVVLVMPVALAWPSYAARRAAAQKASAEAAKRAAGGGGGAPPPATDGTSGNGAERPAEPGPRAPGRPVGGTIGSGWDRARDLPTA